MKSIHRETAGGRQRKESPGEGYRNNNKKSKAGACALPQPPKPPLLQDPIIDHSARSQMDENVAQDASIARNEENKHQERLDSGKNLEPTLITNESKKVEDVPSTRMKESVLRIVKDRDQLLGVTSPFANQLDIVGNMSTPKGVDILGKAVAVESISMAEEAANADAKTVESNNEDDLSQSFYSAVSRIKEEEIDCESGDKTISSTRIFSSSGMISVRDSFHPENAFMTDSTTRDTAIAEAAATMPVSRGLFTAFTHSSANAAPKNTIPFVQHPMQSSYTKPLYRMPSYTPKYNALRNKRNVFAPEGYNGTDYEDGNENEEEVLLAQMNEPYYDFDPIVGNCERRSGRTGVDTNAHNQYQCYYPRHHPHQRHRYVIRSHTNNSSFSTSSSSSSSSILSPPEPFWETLCTRQRRVLQYLARHCSRYALHIAMLSAASGVTVATATRTTTRYSGTVLAHATQSGLRATGVVVEAVAGHFLGRNVGLLAREACDMASVAARQAMQSKSEVISVTSSALAGAAAALAVTIGVHLVVFVASASKEAAVLSLDHAKHMYAKYQLRQTGKNDSMRRKILLLKGKKDGEGNEREKDDDDRETEAALMDLHSAAGESSLWPLWDDKLNTTSNELFADLPCLYILREETLPETLSKVDSTTPDFAMQTVLCEDDICILTGSRIEPSLSSLCILESCKNLPRSYGSIPCTSCSEATTEASPYTASGHKSMERAAPSGVNFLIIPSERQSELHKIVLAKLHRATLEEEMQQSRGNRESTPFQEEACVKEHSPTTNSLQSVRELLGKQDNLLKSTYSSVLLTSSIPFMPSIVPAPSAPPAPESITEKDNERCGEEGSQIEFSGDVIGLPAFPILTPPAVLTGEPTTSSPSTTTAAASTSQPVPHTREDGDLDPICVGEDEGYVFLTNLDPQSPNPGAEGNAEMDVPSGGSGDNGGSGGGWLSLPQFCASWLRSSVEVTQQRAVSVSKAFVWGDRVASAASDRDSEKENGRNSTNNRKNLDIWAVDKEEDKQKKYTSMGSENGLPLDVGDNSRLAPTTIDVVKTAPWLLLPPALVLEEIGRAESSETTKKAAKKKKLSRKTDKGTLKKGYSVIDMC